MYYDFPWAFASKKHHLDQEPGSLDPAQLQTVFEVLCDLPTTSMFWLIPWKELVHSGVVFFFFKPYSLAIISKFVARLQDEHKEHVYILLLRFACCEYFPICFIMYSLFIYVCVCMYIYTYIHTYTCTHFFLNHFRMSSIHYTKCFCVYFLRIKVFSYHHSALINFSEFNTENSTLPSSAGCLKHIQQQHSFFKCSLTWSPMHIADGTRPLTWKR